MYAKFIILLLMALGFSLPSFAQHDYAEQQRVARESIRQAEQNYRERLKNCNSSVFVNSCRDTAKKEYANQRRINEKIIADSRRAERQDRRNDYYQREQERQYRWNDRQFEDRRRAEENQRYKQEKYWERQQKHEARKARDRDKYWENQRKREDFQKKRYEKELERRRRLEQRS